MGFENPKFTTNYMLRCNFVVKFKSIYPFFTINVTHCVKDCVNYYSALQTALPRCTACLRHVKISL